MNPQDEETRELLRLIPQVNELADMVCSSEDAAGLPHRVVLDSTRRTLEDIRSSILGGSGEPPPSSELETAVLARKVTREANRYMKSNLRKVINATGVVLHTNLGRAPLSLRAVENAAEASLGYSNLELQLHSGERGSRQDHVEPLLRDLTGAGAALVVNNNAAAVLLVLAALARGREVIVSRGELVEIGDSFRLPDIMAQSGAVLVEVGATNRTRPDDYGSAIGPDTALIMKIHQSNFRMVGYSEEVPISELVELGAQRFVPVVADLGSGSLSSLEKLGLSGEPTAAETVEAGADLVTFSGDKLLGGPQAGIIVGSPEYIESLRKHPLARALRVDKMTLAALETTLRQYLDEERAWEEVPALKMLAEPAERVRSRANRLKRLLDKAGLGDMEVDVIPEFSRAGGGSLPTAQIPTFCLAVNHTKLSGTSLEEKLRRGEPAVLPRVKEDRLLLDLRTVSDKEVPVLARVLTEIT
jgi:L-seryl-tRNA(Ser) seleniumtransferase